MDGGFKFTDDGFIIYGRWLQIYGRWLQIYGRWLQIYGRWLHNLWNVYINHIEYQLFLHNSTNNIALHDILILLILKLLVYLEYIGTKRKSNRYIFLLKLTQITGFLSLCLNFFLISLLKL